MRIAFIGDPHITDSQPGNRTDNYYEALLNKLEFVCSVCEQKNIKFLVMPGDIFNKPVVSAGVMIDLHLLVRKYNVKPLVIVGQHDLTFRYLNKRTSAIVNLKRINTLQILNKDGRFLNDDTYISGLSYGETDETPAFNKNCKTNILVVHTQVAAKAIAPGVEFTTAKGLVKKYGDFDLIIAGDYHYNYVRRFGQTIVVNAGILCRNSVTDVARDHKPFMYIYDCTNKILTHKEIPHKPAKEIFDLSKKSRIMERDSIEQGLLAAEIEKVAVVKQQTFRDRLVKKCSKNRIGTHVVKIFDEIYTELEKTKENKL